MEESVAWAEHNATDRLLPIVAAPKASFREEDLSGLGRITWCLEV